MEKFKVPVVRIGYGFTTIEVEAKNQEEANEKALDQAGDHEYSEKTSEYQLENEVPTKKVVVFVSTEEAHTRQLHEIGHIALSKLSKFSFDTKKEADSFCTGIATADSLDAFMTIRNFEIKNKTLHLR